MPATKKAGYIEISGTSNTLSTLYSDINDVNYISRSVDVDDTYIYTMNSTNCNYIVILSDATLTIGSSTDYSFREQFRISYSTNSRGYIQTNWASYLNVYGNVYVDLGYGITNPSTQYMAQYSYIYGNLTIEGNETYKPYFIVGRTMDIIFSAGFLESDVNKGQRIKFLNCILGTKFSGNYILYFNQRYLYQPTSWECKNVQIYLPLNSYTYFINIPATNMQLIDNSWLVYENISVHNDSYKTVMFSSGFAGKLLNTNWTTTYNSSFVATNTKVFSANKMSYSTFENSSSLQMFKSAQIIDGMFENVEEFSPYTYNMYNYYYTFLFKNCFVNSVKNQVIYSNIFAVALCWNSDNMFNKIATDNDVIARKVFLLDLTIKDESENLLEGVKIEVNQKDNKEHYLAETDSLGKIISQFDLNGLLLSNRVKINVYGTLEIWSDSSNNTYHTVTVSKEGYKTETFNVVMDEDKTMVVTLKTARAYDSILVDTEEETYINNDESIYYCINSPIKYATTPDVNIKYKKCYLLNLTVEDENGSIENALVDIESGSDDYSFETNSDGKIDTFFNIIGGGVYLTNRHKTSTGEFITSDNSNNTYHIIKVLKEGYEQSFTKVVMDSDKDITIVLKAMEVPKEDIEVEMSTSKLNKVVQGRLLHSVVVSEEVVHIPTPEPEPDPVPTAVIRTTRLTGRIK